MNKSILKPIILGIALGTIIFFTGPLLLIVLLLKFIFTPFGMGRLMMYQRFGNGVFNPQMRFAMADKIRNMSDDEYMAFKERKNNHFSNCKNF